MAAMMMVLYALSGVLVSTNSAVVPNAVMAACCTAAVVREGVEMLDAESHDDSIALENNTMEKNTMENKNKTEWWPCDGLTPENSMLADAESHDDALKNNTMKDKHEMEWWSCDGVTHENNTDDADDLSEMSTNWCWFWPSYLIAENEEAGDVGDEETTGLDMADEAQLYIILRDGLLYVGQMLGFDETLAATNFADYLDCDATPSENNTMAEETPFMYVYNMGENMGETTDNNTTCGNSFDYVADNIGETTMADNMGKSTMGLVNLVGNEAPCVYSDDCWWSVDESLAATNACQA